MQNRLIRSGVLAEVVSLNAAREWIASDLDNIDLGMHPGGETR